MEEQVPSYNLTNKITTWKIIDDSGNGYFKIKMLKGVNPKDLSCASHLFISVVVDGIPDKKINNVSIATLVKNQKKSSVVFIDGQEEREFKRFKNLTIKITSSNNEPFAVGIVYYRFASSL